VKVGIAGITDIVCDSIYFEVLLKLPNVIKPFFRHGGLATSGAKGTGV